MAPYPHPPPLHPHASPSSVRHSSLLLSLVSILALLSRRWTPGLVPRPGPLWDLNPQPCWSDRRLVQSLFAVLQLGLDIKPRSDSISRTCLSFCSLPADSAEGKEKLQAEAGASRASDDVIRGHCPTMRTLCVDTLHIVMSSHITFFFFNAFQTTRVR